MIEGKTIVITGGAGFIGTGLAERFIEKNRVILLDTSFEDQPLRYSPFRGHSNLVLATANVMDYDAVAPWIKEADIVFHLAAVVGVNRVQARRRETLNVNYLGTSNVLACAEGAGRCQRFVYCSTSEVYGTNSYHVREDGNVGLGRVSEARWAYAVSKLAAEHLVWSSYKETSLPITIIRPFNIFGPTRTGDHALLRFLVRALLHRPLEVHGDGSQIRSWCYVDDLKDAVELLVSCPEAIGEDFNVGNPRNTLSIYQLAVKAIEMTQSSSRIGFVARDSSDIDVRVPNIDKARQIVGFEPRFELGDSIERTARWYREHLDDFAQVYG